MDKPSRKLSRRDAIKVLGAAAGASVLATLPTKWTKPELIAGALPAHAQTSATLPTVETVDVGTITTGVNAFINVAYVVPSPHNFNSPNFRFSGKVTSDGGSPLLANGFVWSDSDPNPTLSSNLGVGTPALVAVGATFTFDVFLLDGSYHVRAYATNGVGTGYGSVLNFAFSSA